MAKQVINSKLLYIFFLILFFLTAKEIKDIWHSLRTTFVRQLKKSQSTANYQSTWKHFNAMLFLKNCSNVQSTSTDSVVLQNIKLDSSTPDRVSNIRQKLMN